MKTKVQSLNVAGVLMIIFGSLGLLFSLFGLLDPDGIGYASFSIFARLIEVGAGILAIAFCADRSKAKLLIGLGFAYIATRIIDVILLMSFIGDELRYEMLYYDLADVIPVILVIVGIISLAIHLIVPIVFLTGAFKLRNLSEQGGYGDLPPYEYNPYAQAPYAPHTMPHHNAPLYPPPYPAYPPPPPPPPPPYGMPPPLGSYGAPPVMPTPPFGSVPPEPPPPPATNMLFPPPPEATPDITDDSSEHSDDEDGPTYTSW